MFQSARLKLTGWYLLIILFINIIFSLVIYRVLTNELNRFERAQRFFIERRLGRQDIPFGNRVPLNPALINETRERIVLLLITADLGILILSGGLGYLLAGLTLKPIKKMMDEQNQFITNASHELRTPISTMRAEMETNLLEKHITDSRARALITSNLEELDSLQKLSNSLLQLAENHTYNASRSIAKISIAQVLQAARVKVSPLAKKKSIHVKLEIPPDVIISGEKNSLVELFVILLDNAIKYSSKKTIISVTSKMYHKAMKIFVADHGIGISAEDLPHIFERFYRADKSRSQIEGYGLGLSIAKQIASLHHGSIRVESELDKGTTFIIEFPTYET